MNIKNYIVIAFGILSKRLAEVFILFSGACATACVVEGANELILFSWATFGLLLAVVCDLLNKWFDKLGNKDDPI